MPFAENVVDLVGRRPLVRLSRVSASRGAESYEVTRRLAREEGIFPLFGDTREERS